MAVYEFLFIEVDNRTPAGDSVPRLNKLSQEGWWVEATAIGYPYIHVLLKRPVGGEDAAAADQGACQQDLKTAQEALAAATAQRDQAQADAGTAASERDQAREAGRQFQNQVAQLQQQLRAAASQPSPSG